MKENKGNAVDEIMELGISQLLGLTPYEHRKVSRQCIHIDDGFEYGKVGTSRVIRKCDICGEFYEEVIE